MTYFLYMSNGLVVETNKENTRNVHLGTHTQTYICDNFKVSGNKSEGIVIGGLMNRDL